MAETLFKLVLLRGGPSSVPEVLLEGPVVTIGRSANNMIVLQDTKVSRYHAEVFKADSDWLVKDLNSANGVRVNGARITSRVLAPDDLVAVGETEFRVERCTPKDAEALHAAAPPPAPDDPAGVAKRRTQRVPALDAPPPPVSFDREPIGMLATSQPPAPENAEATVGPGQRIFAPLAPPESAPDSDPAGPANAKTKPTPMFIPIDGGPPMPAAVAPAGLANPRSSPPPANPQDTALRAELPPRLPGDGGAIRLLEPARPAATTAEPSGLDALCEWIARRCAAFQPGRTPALPMPGCIALVGPAGCGKALAVRYAAWRWGLPYARLNLPYLLMAPPAHWTSTLAHALTQSASGAPSLLAIEDADALEDRLDALGDDSLRAWRACLELLAAWLRTRSGPPVVLVTISDPRRAHPALVTRGDSVEEVFYVDLPGNPDRLKVVEEELSARGLSSDGLDPDALVDASAGCSGAQIHRALVDALFAAASHGRDVATADVVDALRRVTPAARRLGAQLDELRAWAQREARRA